jgi:hypothetical protein
VGHNCSITEQKYELFHHPEERGKELTNNLIPNKYRG